MGLDITALRKVKFIASEADYDEMDEKGYDYAWVNTDFPERADGRESGFYFFEEQVGFRAGSYSSYNHFRDWLSQTALGVPAHVVWSNAEEYAERPFFELIHFADNEGIIGPGPAKRLALAFAEHAEQAKATGGDDYYYDTYERFWRAFELAADDGLVQFH